MLTREDYSLVLGVSLSLLVGGVGSAMLLKRFVESSDPAIVVVEKRDSPDTTPPTVVSVHGY